LAVANDKLDKLPEDERRTVMMVSGGYPEEYEKKEK
jgi:hypothetical protein